MATGASKRNTLALGVYPAVADGLDPSTATGIIANWRDMLLGVRKDIQVQVLREACMGSNLQIAVLAYARVDFAATPGWPPKFPRVWPPQTPPPELIGNGV